MSFSCLGVPTTLGLLALVNIGKFNMGDYNLPGVVAEGRTTTIWSTELSTKSGLCLVWQGRAQNG